MPQSTFQPSFAGGELSPELGHRTDLQKYAVGAAKIDNMFVLPRGGLRSRTGTHHIAETKNSASPSRLVEFIFSTTQAYTLEFGDRYIRFFKDGGYIPVSDTDSTPYEIATPYLLSDLWMLKFEQSADTLFIVNNIYAPMRLTRTGHAAWTLTPCAFTNGPLINENTSDTTITLTGGSGDGWIYENYPATITASSGVFVPQHVGSVWGLRCISHTANNIYSIAANSDFSTSFRVLGDWSITIKPGGSTFTSSTFIEKSIDKGATWFIVKTKIPESTSVEYTGSESDECYLRVRRPGVGGSDSATVTVDLKGKQKWTCFKITSYVSATVVTAVMQGNFNRPGNAFKSWAEAAWSDVRGWPGAIAFFQNRLSFGGTKYDPNGSWSSVTDDYENLQRDIPQVDDNAIYQRLMGRTVNSIKWLVPIKALVCLTDNSEWTIQAGNDGTFTFDSLKLDQQTYWGANAQVEPVVLGNAVVFAQRDGGSVRSIGYDYSIDGYTGNDLSVMSQHLLDGYSIVDWAYQQTPSSVLWVVRSDGVLLSFTFHKEHDVWAWAQHHTDGKFESAACIPGDGQDDVYFIVKRTINGQSKRFVERMAARDVSNVANFYGFDCGATYKGTATTTISGLTWLEGANVGVLADGKLYSKTVSSGSITLDKAASTVHVGLNFNWTYKSLQVDLRGTVDHKKSINGITLSVLNSQGGKIATDEKGPYVPIPYETQQLYTGDIVDVPLTTGWDYAGQVYITGTGAFPMHITTIMPQVTVGGK